jgi:hypothetical protein
MSEPITIATSTAAIISALATSVALFLRMRTKERLAAIKGSEGRDKARIVADAVAMFDVSIERLTNEQRYSVVIQQLVAREKQQKRRFILFLALMVFFSATAIALSMNDNPIKKTAPSAFTPQDSFHGSEKAPPIVIQEATGKNSVNVNVPGSGNTVEIKNPDDNQGGH